MAEHKAWYNLQWPNGNRSRQYLRHAHLHLLLAQGAKIAEAEAPPPVAASADADLDGMTPETDRRDA